MSYDPTARIQRMKELSKHMDERIMMCDDEQDLLALASLMIVTAKSIMVQTIGKEGAREIFSTVYKEI